MKKLRILMALALSLGVFTACGNKDAAPAEQPTNEPAATETTETAEPAETETTEPEAGGEIVDGTYEASAVAPAGEVRVEVVLEGGKITAVNVLDHKEDAANEAVKEALTSVPAQIVEKNSTGGITPVEGAEDLSNAIVEAVDTALQASVVK